MKTSELASELVKVAEKFAEIYKRPSFQESLNEFLDKKLQKDKIDTEVIIPIHKLGVSKKEKEDFFLNAIEYRKIAIEVCKRCGVDSFIPKIEQQLQLFKENVRGVYPDKEHDFALANFLAEFVATEIGISLERQAFLN